jgi:hypothetical protein
MLAVMVQVARLRLVREHRVLVTLVHLQLVLVQRLLVQVVTSVSPLALVQAEQVARLRLLRVRPPLMLHLVVQWLLPPVLEVQQTAVKVAQ